MPGLALDPERTASGARAHRVHRSLPRLAAASQPGPDAAERSDISGEVGGHTSDNGETSRPSWWTLARVRARRVSEASKRTLQGSDQPVQKRYSLRCRNGNRSSGDNALLKPCVDQKSNQIMLELKVVTYDFC